MTSKILRSGGTEITGIKSVIYTEKVNAGTNLRPGCVASAYIDVEVFGSQSAAPGADEALTYYQVDSEGNETLIGVFYAEPSVPSRNTYKFTAYDAVSKLDKPYSERLNAIQANFPMSIYDLVSDACSVAGVTLGSSSWPLSTQSVEAFYADGLTCRNILQYAAEIAGRFVRCNTSGEVIFDWYTTASTGITPGTTTGNVPFKQGGLTYDNFTVTPVDAVAIKPAGTEGAAYIYPTSYGTVSATDPNGDGNVILQNLVATDDGNGNLYLSVGAEDDNGNVEITQSASASNTLILSGNLLLTNATEQTYTAAAQNVYQVMSSLPAYRHAVVQLFNFLNPFRAGQFVSITDAQGVSFTAPIFEMRVQASGAEIKSSGKQSYEDTEQTTVAKTLANLANNIVQIDKLKVGYAEIDEAVINTIAAQGITAEWLDSKEISTSSINFTDSSTIPVPSENDEDSLYSGQYIDEGWILSTGQNYIFNANQSALKYLKGKTITFTLECRDSPPTGGRYYYVYYKNTGSPILVPVENDGTWSSASGVITEASYKENGHDIYIYTQTITLYDVDPFTHDVVELYDEYWISVDAAIRRIRITMTGGSSVELSGSGLTIGDFTVDRSGVAKYDGSNVLTENTGVKKSGDTMTGNLVINGSTDVGTILTALTADSGWIDLSPVFYRKVGTTVFVSCHAQYSSALTGQTWTTIATLPAGYRPSRRIDASGAFGANAEIVGSVKIESSGNIDVYPSAAVASPYIAFSTAYPV